ncbi:hypothetical protein SAMN04488503_1939 [Humidesulfovibrio mexicanus]|uniref:Uncharacterized protein n=1 Tax=Humidesulfovibrio mexicanus TaxID=147047 RepID=A0A239A9H4_9BACT|nr:hypothetical protein [Humidesulfovibrio mexicanus]SNR92285.1 hypothetical protein SAMN04488503_1939 [Humidesulfovibrio mexicanus]
MHAQHTARRGLFALLRAAHKYLFRVAPLPHATGSAAALLGAALTKHSLEFLAEGALAAAALLALPASGWMGLAVLCAADGFCRHREYQRLKCALARRGFHPRLLAPVSASRCQRDAALAAARELGHLARARAHFRALGYRWWHLLPDGTTDNPLRFFDPAFLRATFLPGRPPGPTPGQMPKASTTPR